MSQPFIFVQNPNLSQTVSVDISTLLQQNETLTSVALGSVSPSTTPSLAATLVTSSTTPSLAATLVTSSTTNPLLINLAGGVDGVTYGFQITVTTNARVFLVQIAIPVYSNSDFEPYTTKNPYDFQDLVDELTVGEAAIGTAVFAFPPAVDPRGGFVTYELLAQDGTVYSAGNAYSYSVTSNGISNIVKAQAVIIAPSTIPPSLQGQSYQLRYTLELPQVSGVAGDPETTQLSQNTFYQFENIKIIGYGTVPLGTQPSVEITGTPATLQLVTEKLWDNVTCEIWYSGNRIAAPFQVTEYQRTSNGWYWSAVVQTEQLMVSLIPYTIIWKYWSNTNTALVFQETTNLWIINDSISTAILDVRSKINKAHTTLFGHPDLLYTNPVVMTWLRRGGDYFNGAYGQFTNFTFTNATGPVREYWLMSAEKAALESQYMAEGEKAFNFQGAAISLDVDRTQYIDNAIGKIQSVLDAELKMLKQNLIIKGNTKGPGNMDPTALQYGAIGAVGVTLTAASMWGRGYSYGAWGLK